MNVWSRVGVVVVLGACVGCRASLQAPAGSQLESTRLSTCGVDAAPGVRATFRGGLALRWPGWSGFGGWSDLRVHGDDVATVSDDGHALGFHVTSEAGTPVAANGLWTGVLPGGPDKLHLDVESFARFADGTIWLATEAQPLAPARILAFAPAAETAPTPFTQPLPDPPVPPGLSALPYNAGLEAMTVLADQSVLAIAEGPEPVPPLLPAWRWTGQAWQTLHFPTQPPYRPVALAPLPPGHPLGDALVLERKWSGGVAGTSVRAVRLPTAGDTLAVTDIVHLLPEHCPLDNFEGLDVRVEGGTVWLWLLSDDNLSPKQRTLLYVLTLESAPK